EKGNTGLALVTFTEPSPAAWAASGPPAIANVAAAPSTSSTFTGLLMKLSPSAVRTGVPRGSRGTGATGPPEPRGRRTWNPTQPTQTASAPPPTGRHGSSPAGTPFLFRPGPPAQRRFSHCGRGPPRPGPRARAGRRGP